MSGSAVLHQVLNGISLGALLFLVTSGFTLIFGLMRVVNLAHGAFYLLGGLIGYSTLLMTGNFATALLVGGCSAMILAFAVDLFLLKPIRHDQSRQILLTSAIAIMAGDAVIAVWGGDPVPVPRPDLFIGSIPLFGIEYPSVRAFMVVIAFVVALLLWLGIGRSRLGAYVRAGVDDREMLQAMGVNVQHVFAGITLLGGLLAGFSGVLGGTFLTLYPGAEWDILLYALVVIIIGGLGSLEGALIGSILIGLIDSFGRYYAPDLAYFLIYAPVAVLIVIRPQGFFGRGLE